MLTVPWLSPSAGCVLAASVCQWPTDGGDVPAGAALEWAAGVLLWRPGGRAQLRGAPRLRALQRLLPADPLIIRLWLDTVAS